ncbi:conserved protein, unknown function [Hepatocystis sp. ex Piliocolobus tephrosceles]|nr:conserved protein, unknown function [Hepatocystis sp. ex Piliocolobus tephrosceles]
MKASNLNICVQVKCVSFCSSNFNSNTFPGKKKNENVDKTEKVNKKENKFVNKNETYEYELKKLVGNVFIGKVLNVEDCCSVDDLKGKKVIGIFTLRSKIKDDKIIIPYHDIIKYPDNNLNDDYSVCATLRSLYESYICLNTINYTNKLDYIAIFSYNIFHVLPLLNFLLMKKFFILIFLPKENEYNNHNSHNNHSNDNNSSNDNNDNNNKIGNDDIQANINNMLKKFHINNELIKNRISIINIDMTFGNNIEHVHNLTNKLGIKTIVVYPNLNIDITILKKYIFTICGFNAKLIFSHYFDYLSPNECILLHEKGITIEFFNINNYIYYDYFKIADAFNYVLLSILNKDIQIPSVTINKSYFSNLKELFSCTYSNKCYSIFINKNVDSSLDNL